MEITKQKLKKLKEYLLKCNEIGSKVDLYDVVEPFISDDGIAVVTPWCEAGSGSDKIFTDAEMVEHYGLANIVQFIIDNIALIDSLKEDLDNPLNLDFDEASKPLDEAYALNSFDFESEVDYYGAVYCARELVYDLVNDPEDAAELSDWADSNDNLSSAEFWVLQDLIGDALEGANCHTEMMDYVRSDPFPYWDSFKASASDKAKIDSLIAKCKTIKDKRLLIWDAINAALYSY